MGARERFPEVPDRDLFAVPPHFGSASEPYITLPPLRSRDPAQRRERCRGRADLPQAAAPAATAPDAQPLRAVLPGTGPGGSVGLVLSKRIEQVAQGYTPEADARLPIGFLLTRALAEARDARDWLARPEKDPRRDHYLLKLVNMGALVLAEIDRLQARERGANADAPQSPLAEREARP